MSQNMAEFTNVTKEYSLDLMGTRKLRALEDLTLAIRPGEVLGLLGPNRAGKTTLVKILLSLTRPTRGSVTRFGQPAADRGTLARVGYVHENQAFPRYLTARQLLEYYGALSLLTQPVVKQRVPDLLELVGLSDRADEPIARFSKGMVQRLGIAQALVNDPDLLVLDEPSEGLDVLGRQLVREIVARQKTKGRTVLFVSHVIPEVETICDRVIILRAGRLVQEGTIPVIKATRGGPARSLEDVLKEMFAPGKPQSSRPKDGSV